MSTPKYHYDKFFFNVPTLENSYWAGFIAADGTIDNKWNNSLKIALAEKDVEHLRTLAKTIGYDGPLLYSVKTKSYALQLYGAHQFSYDLENIFNATNKKSLTLCAPYELYFWSDTFLKSYLVGFIDGDGSIKFCKRDRALIVDIFSGSERFVKWVKVFLEKTYDLPDKRIYSYSSTGFLYRLQGKNAIKVLTDLAKLNVPKLSRKWNKLNNIGIPK